MINKRTASALLMLCLSSVFSVAKAENVSLTHNGLVLNANLEMAEGKTVKDPVIVLTHGTLAHNKMEIISQLQKLLKENHFSTLAVNLGLGISNREGMYDCATTHRHKHADAVEEIGLWVDWLKQKGADNLILMGHSRGGNQTAWYAAEHDDPAIKKVVLIAPATWSQKYAVSGYKKQYKKDLLPILKKAQDLVAAGKGDEVMTGIDHIYCPDTSVTAASFVSYYQPDERFDTPYLLPRIKQPVLVFAGSADTTVKDLEQKVGPLVVPGKIDLSVIDGAGHMFRDLYMDDLVEQIVEYLNLE